jgi:hypothetical protein
MNSESSMRILNTIVKFSPYLLVLITVIVFFPTFSNDFQRDLDDIWQVLENPFVLDPSFENILYHFTYFYGGQYSPVNTLFYIVLNELFGFNAKAFHATFLMVHALNVVLVYYFIKDIVKTAKPKFEIIRIQLFAFFVALIFAIHPLQVESVAWISASKVVLFTFFMLAAIWCYLHYIRSAKLSWLFAVALLYALSFGSKEQAIILPLNLLALDYLYGRFKGWKFRFAVFKKKVLLEKIPFFLMTIGFMYFHSLFGPENFTRDIRYTFPQRLLFGMHSIDEYIFRTIAPVKLYFIYFFPIRIGEELPLFYWGYLVLTLIIMAFVWGNYRKNNRLVIFGFLIFIINILLVIHIIPLPRDFITADRYMYASIIGLALIGIWFLDGILIKYVRYKKQLLALVAIYVVALGMQSYWRTQEWKDSKTMKKNIIELIEKRKALKQPVTNNPLIQAHDE